MTTEIVENNDVHDNTNQVKKAHKRRHNIYEDEMIADLQEQTDLMNAYSNNYVARKKVCKIAQEEDEHKEMLRLGRRLDRVRMGHVSLYDRQGNIAYADLPQDIYEVTKHIAGCCGWDYFPVLLLLLVSASFSMRGRYKAVIDQEWEEAIVLYLLLCAESGNMKSAMVNMVYRPHMLFEEQKQQQYNENMAKLKVRADKLKQAKKIVERACLRRHAKAIDFESNNIEEFVNNFCVDQALIDKNIPIEDSPVLPVLNFQDTSLQKLYTTMNQQGGGSNFISAEGNTFLHLVNTPRANLDIFAKGFNYENHIYATKKDGTLQLQKPFVNIALITNPDVARQLYSNRRIGLHGITPRMMVCFCGKRFEARNCEAENNAYVAYKEKIMALLDKSYSQLLPRNIIEIRFDREAQDELMEICSDLDERHDKIPAKEVNYRAYMRKQRGLVVRIATVLHVWRHSEPEKILVSKPDVLLAEEIVHALMKHAEYAFSPTGLQAMYDAQKILDWISRHRQDMFTSHDVALGVENMRNSTIFPALDALEQENIIKQKIPARGPRRCVVHRDFWLSQLPLLI